MILYKEVGSRYTQTAMSHPWTYSNRIHIRQDWRSVWSRSFGEPSAFNDFYLFIEGLWGTPE